MRDLLIKALSDHFDTEAIFKAAIGGRLFLGEASQKTPVAFPYAVIQALGGSTFWTFREDFETHEVPFLLCSRQREAAEVLGLADKLKNCFDEARLNVTGWHCIRFWRTGDSLDYSDGTWHHIVRYTGQFEKQVAVVTTTTPGPVVTTTTPPP